MKGHNLLKQVEARLLTVDGTNFTLAAGTTDVNSGSVDMRGYQAVTFMLAVGAIAGSGSVAVKAQQSDDDGSTDDYTDIAGSSSGASADTDDNKIFFVDIYRPLKRYVRFVTTRGDGGNSTLLSLTALLSRAQAEAVTQGATVFSGSKTLNNPAEGTA